MSQPNRKRKLTEILESVVNYAVNLLAPETKEESQLANLKQSIENLLRPHLNYLVTNSGVINPQLLWQLVMSHLNINDLKESLGNKRERGSGIRKRKHPYLMKGSLAAKAKQHMARLRALRRNS